MGGTKPICDLHCNYVAAFAKMTHVKAVSLNKTRKTHSHSVFDNADHMNRRVKRNCKDSLVGAVEKRAMFLQ
jgi:hydrogenase maturation factor HypF (carbamoyltransferase family)